MGDVCMWVCYYYGFEWVTQIKKRRSNKNADQAEQMQIMQIMQIKCRSNRTNADQDNLIIIVI